MERIDHIMGQKSQYCSFQVDLCIYRCGFNAIAIKTPASFCFVEIDELILKFLWKCKRPQIVKRALQKDKVEN